MILKHLTLTDKCDRCVAQARVSVTLHGGGELQFCKNHYERHEKQLQSLVLTINDQRKELEQQEGVAA
jgi:hypothetical protein